MTGREHDLLEAWAEWDDANAEHDQPHAQRAWDRIRQLQQRGPSDAEAEPLAHQAHGHSG